MSDIQDRTPIGHETLQPVLTPNWKVDADLKRSLLERIAKALPSGEAMLGCDYFKDGCINARFENGIVITVSAPKESDDEKKS